MRSLTVFKLILKVREIDHTLYSRNCYELVVPKGTLKSSRLRSFESLFRAAGPGEWEDQRREARTELAARTHNVSTF